MLKASPWLAGQWEALQAACAEEGESPDSGRLRPVHGFVDHSQHLRRCSMVVHSGGMGTMLAALLAGLPAVACPLHFDQHQNVYMPLLPVLPCSCILK